MARINRIAFNGVPARDLSRHLRNNGCKVTLDPNEMILIARSDKTAEQLKKLVEQLKGCDAVIVPVNRV